MIDIPNHPEIQWIEKTGYPSWMQGDEAEEVEEVEDDDNERDKQ